MNRFVDKYVDRHPVLLNVYDITQFNNYLEKIGVGVYHSGIQVFDSEYSYGVHHEDCSGIYDILPKTAEEYQPSFKYKKTVFIGLTKYSQTEFSLIVNKLGKNQFKGNKYHLFSNNCNHFSDKLAQILCGKPIPRWVNRLARIGSNIPLLDTVLPQHMLTPIVTMAPKDTIKDMNERQKNYIV